MEFDEKCLIRGDLAHFSKKPHFGDPIDLQNFFNSYHEICLIDTLHLSIQMSNGKMNFLIKKGEDSWKLKKCHHRFNHLLFSQGSYSHFSI